MPARHLWIVSLGVAWLAGFGFDRVCAATAKVGAVMLRQVFVAFVGLTIACVAIVLGYTSWHKPGLTYPGFWIPAVSAMDTGRVSPPAATR